MVIGKYFIGEQAFFYFSYFLFFAVPTENPTPMGEGERLLGRINDAYAMIEKLHRKNPNLPISMKNCPENCDCSYCRMKQSLM